MIDNHCYMGKFKLNKFKLDWLNRFNWFENVPFDVWHNLQELPHVDNIFSLQNLSTMSLKISTKLFFGNIICGVN